MPKLFFFLLLACLCREVVLRRAPSISSIQPEDIRHLMSYMARAGVAPDMMLKTSAKLNETKCHKDLLHFINGVNTAKLWALAMLDASFKPTPGLLFGNRILYGSQDNCLLVQPPHSFRPKFCMFSIHNKTQLLIKDMFFIWARAPYMFAGVCMPSSCPANYVARVLNGLESPMANFKMSSFVNISVDQLDCKTNTTQIPWKTINSVTAGIFGTILVLVLLATLVHQIFDTNKLGSLGGYVEAVSIATNGGRLFSSEGVSSFESGLNGAKGFVALGMLFGHGLMYIFMGNLANMLHPRVITGFADPLVATFFFGVDFFLFLTGIMVTAMFFSKLHTKRKYEFILPILTRYLRSTIPIAVLLLYKLGINEHMDDGPIYNAMNTFYRKQCDNTVVPTLLGYVNWVHNSRPYDRCYQQLWHSSVDIQLFIFSQLILLTCWWSPTLVATIPFVLGCVISVTNFITAYTYEMAPYVTISNNMNNFIYDYTMTHSRSVPWLFGMTMGCFLVKYKTRPFTISRITKWIMWMLSAGIIIGGYFWLKTFSLKIYTQPSSALFLALGRVLPCIVYGWLVFSLQNDMAGFLGKFLGWYPFDFLGRISLETYLTHIAVLEFTNASSRELYHMTKESYWHFILLPLAYTIMWGIVFHLFVTAPWSRVLSKATANSSIWCLDSPIPEKKEEEPTQKEEKTDKQD